MLRNRCLPNAFTDGLAVEGDIVVNGRPIGNYMRHISGFMDQHDIFIGSLTVYEHLWITVSCFELDLQSIICGRRPL